MLLRRMCLLALVVLPAGMPTAAASPPPDEPVANGGATPEQRRPPQARPPCRPLGRFRATVYGPPWTGLEGPPWTAMGHRLRPGRHIIAVDPRVIRLGSRVRVWPNPLGWRGAFVAGDTGGAIAGHRLDIFTWKGRAAMDRWGVRAVRVCLERRR